MESMSPFILAAASLIGTIVGGLLTWLTQSRAEIRRESTALKAEERAVNLAIIERSRGHVRAIHEQISHDLADIRLEVTNADEQVNQVRAELLDQMVKSILHRHDRAAVLIAQVDDEDVRNTADSVYGLWGRYASFESALMNKQADPNKKVPVGKLQDGSGAFTNAVRTKLSQLNTEETALFSAS